MVGLAMTALLMSRVDNIPVLVVALAFLHFFGQGMLSHVAMTAMARWFNHFRGRAISLAGFGFTLGDSLLPLTLTLAIAALGWRDVWVVAGLVLAIAFVPVLIVLLRDAPDSSRALAAGHSNSDAPETGTASGEQWTRGRVLRDPLFYAIVLGIMGPPAIGTLFIFHQAYLVGLKGWELTTFTAFFPFMSVTGAATGLGAGFFVDRLGAWRLMPVVLLPLALACLIVGMLTPVWAIPLMFLSFGLTQGMMNPVVGALWVELYGTAHLGAIRSSFRAGYGHAPARVAGASGE